MQSVQRNDMMSTALAAFLLDVNFDALLVLGFRNTDGQDAILEFRSYAIAIDTARQPDCARELRST